MIYRFDIDLKYGPRCRDFVTKKDWQRTIDALDRVIHGKGSVADFDTLVDLKSILKTMGEQLPEC